MASLLLISAGFGLGCLVFILILLIEIRLVRRDSSITDRIARSVERLSPRRPAEILKPPTPAETRWQEMHKGNKDIKLDDFYEGKQE